MHALRRKCRFKVWWRRSTVSCHRAHHSLAIFIHRLSLNGTRYTGVPVTKLGELCELILSQPGMGVARLDVAGNVQSLPVDNYVIYYEQNDSTLSVLRVWHTAQDPASLTIDPVE